MGVKKKKETQVTSLTVCHQDLETLKSLADVEGKNLASLLLHCVQLTDGVSQIRYVKQIVPLLEKANKNGTCDPTIRSCLDILAGIYLSLTLKNPLKKVLASSLNGLPEFFLIEATQSFTSRLQEELNTSTDLYSYRRVIDNISSCMENFDLGKLILIFSYVLFVSVLHFLQKSLIEISEENRQVFRVFMLVPLRTLSLYGLPWTIQSTSGLAVILFIKAMFHPPEKIPDLISSVLLRSVDPTSAPEWLLSCCKSLCCADVPPSALLFLCQGTLTMLDWQEGRMGPSGEALLLNTVHVLFTLSSQIKESTLEMFLSRILASWTNSAIQVLDSSSPSLKDSLNGNADVVRRLLDYVYTHWEHPLDALRHQTKIIFRNILQMHQLTVEESGSDLSADRFIVELTESLLRLEWHSKGKYTCLGVDHILALAKTIPLQILEVMGDQSLVPYASDLLETMFKNHKSRLKSQAADSTWIDEWHETWVFPLLCVLCEGSLDQKSYVIDYYLPKLLNCNPESLSYMVKILQTSADAKTGKKMNFFCFRSYDSRGALGALMACLRTARAHGHLQSATDAWRDLVSSARIKQGLIHQHCQVRIDTLGLLCESNRSTEIVSTEEMQWIQFFITYNLNSQSPGVRQQICSLLKKLFCRIQESSQVLYKLEQSKSKHEPGNESTRQHPSVSLQQYKHILSPYCVSLFPGSSYPTRFSALTILGSIAEVFPVPEGRVQTVYQLSHDIDAGRFQTLMECLTGTFEEVKILAFDLLMKLPKTFVQFQGSVKLQGLFQAALELSTSTKPYDCVTASYLLNFLIWQNNALPSSLSAYLKTQRVACGDGDKSAAVVESNTLIVIKCLLEKLEEEVSRAENSLLQAAASFPMYGRVHCITGALRRLPLNSSPEGLIPNDTDAGHRLHRILNEIQPRDTNDYFSRAKILKECGSFDLEDLSASVPNIDTSAEIKGKEGKTCDVTAQMVLVCCWRSMKEVALLLGSLCQLLPMRSVPEPPDGLLTVQQVKEIGDYFKQHLLQSRHRGAFELAYTGFVKLTEILNRCPNVSLQKLPEEWLLSVLEEIKCCDPSSKLCATRRSAGIPFYIQALLASEPKKGKMDLLKITMKELISLAGPTDGSQSTVPKVHALNILRALFRDTRLGEIIIPYVADGTKAAILGFTSPVWAVRNSSTLLFSTLITRIFGVKRGKDELSKKNRMTGSEFFSRFPELYPFLLKQLETVANTVDSDTGELNRHPSMFLLLLVLGRLYPSPMDGTCSALSMAPFIPFIMRCGHSPVYRSREMAARALVPFVMMDEIPNTIQTLLAKLPDCTDQCFRQNHIHGTLLQVFHLLQAFSDSKYRMNTYFQQELADVAVCTKAKLWLAKRQNPCLVTRAVYIDILFLLTCCLDKLSKGNQPVLEHLGFWEEIGRIISGSELITGFPYTYTVPGLPQYLQSLTKLAIAAVWAVAAQAGEQNRDVPISFSQLLESSFPEVRLLTLEALLERFSTAASENHPECLCKILKILHCLDPSEWLPQTEHRVHLSPKEFLIWTMDIASHERSEIQSEALRLTSKVIAHHMQTCDETRDLVAPNLQQWVQLVVSSCGDHLPTESRLAAAEVLASTAPFFLTNPQPILGLQDTLALWKCVLTLLQSEEQVIRDAATETVMTAMSQENTRRSTEFAFCQVDASSALDLALAVLCDLLQQWDQLTPGLPVLLGWLLGEGEDLMACEESAHQVEEDYPFEKTEINFWAETLIFVKYLYKHLFRLLSESSWRPLSPEMLHHLQRTASEQCHLLSQLFRVLPPTAEFLKTAELTRLRIWEERTLACLRLLALLEGKEGEDTLVLRALDSPAAANQLTLPRTETAC
uniref:tRNA (32-2'-O)-methyltransferase regulator THADA n=1 Tax=Capra hircus TaxID=9925 RepID=A0A8C2NLN2_CAPHI